VKVKREVVPGVGLEPVAGDAGMCPFPMTRVPDIPNASSIVALGPEHEFCPGRELGDLLIELENIELKCLRVFLYRRSR
jgi:hypothetical protein